MLCPAAPFQLGTASGVPAQLLSLHGYGVVADRWVGMAPAVHYKHESRPRTATARGSMNLVIVAGLALT